MLRFKERVEQSLTELKEQIGELKELLLLSNKQTKKNMASLKKLEDAVAKATSINESAIALIQGISKQIKDAGTDEAKLNALTEKLDANEDALAAAVAANTPATEPTPVDPTTTGDVTSAESGDVITDETGDVTPTEPSEVTPD